MIDIQIIKHELDLTNVEKMSKNPACGGMVFFEGRVRDQTKGKTVLRLEFEAYEPMALKEMKKIADFIKDHWHAFNIVIHHRVGVLEIGEVAVIIAVSTPHRKAAFEACQYAIDTLKETVPIWKKEIFKNGEVWVASHP
jgi:molybdopterin synthase catalytic subunit